jgi:hypothetical protein
LSDGVNRYGYCRSNPVVLHDADGTDSALTDFDRAWVAKIALPILLTEVYQDKQGTYNISLERRILMVAHARTESTSQAQDTAGKYKDPEGFNVFNVQVPAGTKGSKTVQRAEYVKKVDPDKVDSINLNESVSVTSGSRKDQWKRYRKSGDEVKELGNVSVGIPMYSNMEQAIKGYFTFLQAKPGKKSYSALTDSSVGTAQFYAGLKGYGTDPRYADPATHIGALAKEVSGTLLAYAKERLPQIKQEIASLQEQISDINTWIAENRQAVDQTTDQNEKDQYTLVADNNQAIVERLQYQVEGLKQEERVLNQLVANPPPTN